MTTTGREQMTDRANNAEEGAERAFREAAQEPNGWLRSELMLAGIARAIGPLNERLNKIEQMLGERTNA